MTGGPGKSPAAWHPSRRLWRAYFNAPLYVPPEIHSTLRVLESRGRDAFVAELQRLSSLNSPAASALLGLLCLTPDSGGTRDPKRAMELCKSHSDAGNTYAQFVYAWAQLFAAQPKPAIATMNNAANRLFPPATIDLIAFVWSTVGKEQRRAELATKMLDLASRSGHKSALLWRCALDRSGCFGVWPRFLGILLTPIGFIKAVGATLFGRPFSAEVFTFPKRLTGPLIRAEAKFSLYNDLAETPVLDERRTFHRYVLALAHMGAATAAILGGHIFALPGAKGLNGWSVAALVLPYLASAPYSIRVVSYQRIRLVLFVLLLGAGALLTGSFVAGAISSVDSVTAFIDIVGVELAAFIWAAEFLLDAP